MKKIQVAIDGPASAGKSTVAKIVAKKLHLIYCDTGAMYRAVTYAAIKEHVELDDDQALKHLLGKIEIRFVPAEPEQRVFVNQEEVTQVIRTPEITNNVSVVSAQPSVRAELTNRQQVIARDGGIVMDGRDIGTTVLPNADVKIYLIASVHERAMRRFKENQIKGINTPLDVLEKEIEERDYKDSHREISPLTQAKDAVLVDTTSQTIDQVVDQILKIIDKKTKQD